jgi:Flp pilus assembly pilin Flp
MPKGSRHSGNGQAKVEYVVLISLVGLLVIGGLILVGPGIGDLIETVEEELGGATPTVAPESTPYLTVTSTPEPTPSPTPEAEERLSYSDFEDGTGLEWYEAVGRNWNIEDGAYCVEPGGEHRSFTGDEGWTDYVIELTSDLSQGKGFGVYFRATDPDSVNAYCFQYDPGHGHGAFLFRKVVNGHGRSPSARVWAPKDYDWHSGPRDIRLEVIGNTYTAFVDGEQVAQLEDDSYTHGAIGLRTWDASRACFDNVSVTAIK